MHTIEENEKTKKLE